MNKASYVPVLNKSTGKESYANRKEPKQAYDLSMGAMRRAVKDYLSVIGDNYKLMTKNDMIWYFDHKPVGNPMSKQYPEITEYWPKVEMGEAYFNTLPYARHIYCVGSSDREIDKIEEDQNILDELINKNGSYTPWINYPHLVAIHTYNRVDWRDEWTVVSARQVRKYWDNQYHDDVTAVNLAIDNLRYDEVPRDFKASLGRLEDVMEVMPDELKLIEFMDPNEFRCSSDVANLYDRHWQTKDYAGNPNRDPKGGMLDRHMSRATLHKYYGNHSQIAKKKPKTLFNFTDSYEYAENVVYAYLKWIEEDPEHLGALMDEDDRLIVCPKCAYGFSEAHGADKSRYPMLKCPKCGANVGKATVLFSSRSLDQIYDAHREAQDAEDDYE